MDPNATLVLIDTAPDRSAELREAMENLHEWLMRGGFPPDWKRYPKGRRRFRKKYGPQRGMS